MIQILGTNIFYVGLQHQFLLLSFLYQRTVSQRKILSYRFLVIGLIRENVGRNDQNLFPFAQDRFVFATYSNILWTSLLSLSSKKHIGLRLVRNGWDLATVNDKRNYCFKKTKSQTPLSSFCTHLSFFILLVTNHLRSWNILTKFSFLEFKWLSVYLRLGLFYGETVSPPPDLPVSNSPLLISKHIILNYLDWGEKKGSN